MDRPFHRGITADGLGAFKKGGGGGGGGGGSGGNIDYSTLPSYLFQYAPSGVAQSSGAVTSWTDAAPGGKLMTPASASPIFVASALNGFGGVQFTSSTPRPMSTGAGTYAFNSPRSTVYLVGKFSTSAIGLLVETTDNAQTNGGIWTYNQGAILNVQDGVPIAENYTGLSNTYGVWVFQYDNAKALGTSVAAYYGRSRLHWSGSASGNLNNLATGALHFGGRAAGAFPADATLVHVLGYSDWHSEANIQACVDSLLLTYGLAGTAPNRALYLEGDSISCNTGTSKSYSAHIVYDGDFPNYALGSCAWPSKTLAQGYANRVNQIGLVRSATGTKYAFIFAGTNDAASSSSLTPAQLFTTLQNYTAALFAAGYTKVFWMTMLPRGGIFSGGQTAAGFEAFREGTGSYNALMRAGAAAAGATLIDVAQDANIGVAGSFNSSTYYNPDLVHLTDAGHVVAYNGYVKPALIAAA